MHLINHLTDPERDIILDKASRYLAEILANQQKDYTVYVGQAEVAVRLNCSRATVGKIMAEGRLKYSRVGKKGYQFREADVVEYLQAA